MAKQQEVINTLVEAVKDLDNKVETLEEDILDKEVKENPEPKKNDGLGMGLFFGGLAAGVVISFLVFIAIFLRTPEEAPYHWEYYTDTYNTYGGGDFSVYKSNKKYDTCPDGKYNWTPTSLESKQYCLNIDPFGLK